MGALRWVFAAYLSVVAWGVFGPDPGEQVSRTGEGAHTLESEVRSVVPGGGSTAGTEPGRGDDKWVFGDLSAEDVGNVAMFVPFGVLFPLVWPRWRWWSVPAGVTLSAFIELTQLLFLSWRSPSLEDVAWNSVGACCGFALSLAGSWSWRRRPGRARA